jgi:hypothetical protein
VEDKGAQCNYRSPFAFGGVPKLGVVKWRGLTKVHATLRDLEFMVCCQHHRRKNPLDLPLIVGSRCKLIPPQDQGVQSAPYSLHSFIMFHLLESTLRDRSVRRLEKVGDPNNPRPAPGTLQRHCRWPGQACTAPQQVTYCILQSCQVQKSLGKRAVRHGTPGYNRQFQRS